MENEQENVFPRDGTERFACWRSIESEKILSAEAGVNHGGRTRPLLPLSLSPPQHIHQAAAAPRFSRIHGHLRHQPPNCGAAEHLVLSILLSIASFAGRLCMKRNAHPLSRHAKVGAGARLLWRAAHSLRLVLFLVCAAAGQSLDMLSRR
jgi:hypothetical protein